MNLMRYGLTAAVVCSFALVGTADAAGKKPSKPEKPVRIRAALVVDPALTDLAGSKGSLDYQGKKPSSLKAVVRLPLVSASLGIADAATAAAAQIHLEFVRGTGEEGTVVADCSLALQADSDPATPDSHHQYRLHVKSTGKKDVKGTCGGTVPVLQKGDVASVYAIVNGTRVDFMDSGS